MNICDIVTSPWTYCQFGHLGSRSGCQAIGIALSDASMDLKPHASGSLLPPPLALILRCFFNPMSYQVDDVFGSHWWAHHRCQLLRDRYVSVYFLLESWAVCTPRTWCTVHEATPLEGRLKAHDTPVTTTVWRLEGYKFTLYLMLIPISHPSLLLALGFFSFLSFANH
jgi:hypothetical protein